VLVNELDLAIAHAIPMKQQGYPLIKLGKLPSMDEVTSKEFFRTSGGRFEAALEHSEAE
jgi:hypothetical protein